MLFLRLELLLSVIEFHSIHLLQSIYNNHQEAQQEAQLINEEEVARIDDQEVRARLQRDRERAERIVEANERIEQNGGPSFYVNI